MNFKTDKKEFSIEFKDVSDRHNGVLKVFFEVSVSKPFQAINGFANTDIGERQNVKGIVFSEYSKIAEILGAKKNQEVLFSLPQEAIEFIEKASAEALENLKRTAQAKTIQKWCWAIGGDTHNMYLTTDDLTSEEKSFRPDIKNIEKVIEKTRFGEDIWKLLREKSHDTDRKTALYTNQWHEISNADLMEIYSILQKQEDEEGRKKKQAHEEKEKRIQEAFAKAKETGRMQEIAHWIEDCNDPQEECDCDHMYKYAMPDGSTKTERNHTW